VYNKGILETMAFPGQLAFKLLHKEVNILLAVVKLRQL
jgi:hypothetical protein